MFKKSLSQITSQFTRLQSDLEAVISDRHTDVSNERNTQDRLNKEIEASEAREAAHRTEIEKAQRIKSRIADLLA